MNPAIPGEQAVYDVPDWVPTAVKAIAPVAPGDETRKQNLLKDERMKRVWFSLRQEKVTPAGLADIPSHQRAEYYGLAPAGDGHDRAFAALFVHALFDLHNAPAAWTNGYTDKLAEEFETAVRICNFIATDPMFKRNLKGPCRTLIPAFEEYARRLRTEHRLVDFGQHDEPFIITQKGGSRGDDEARGPVRQLACVVHRLFGKFLHTPTATIASVSLGREITTKVVEGWSIGLSARPARNVS